MSCHMNKCANIVNCKDVKSVLNFHGNPEFDPYSSAAWNDAWDIDDAAETNQDTQNSKLEDSAWLQQCVISLSPSLDILAFAHQQHVVFLTSKWDNHAEGDVKMKFVSCFEGKLTDANCKDEEITSLMCLPLASQKRSLQGGPDWTCIIVGYSSGYIRIYTEKANLLLSQLLHEEPVHHFKCKTFANQHFPNAADQPEELLIVYSSAIVTIDGFGLFQTLRACRNQLARSTAGKQEAVQPPPLSYKKFGMFRFDDCEAAGVISGSAFDHLVSESIRKGYYGAVKPAVPSYNLLITSGSNPYVGFYHASEVSSQLLLTDVVHAVASKLMSFISHSNAGGLIGGLIGRGDSVKNKPKIEPPTNLPLRFGLYDKRRQGASIVLSPNKLLAAVSDGFGRVILFDVAMGLAVRMWKGYRDAECGWIEVNDNIPQKDRPTFLSDKKRQAFFLVIYAPRRGILEVWCSQQGPRVAAFNVGKSGRLLFPGYTMVGSSFNTISARHQHDSTCYFLDVDGGLKKLVVPFHLTLSERNSKHVRDLHLLKEFRLVLKNNSKGKTTELIKILKDMRTSNIRLQAMDSLFSTPNSTTDVVETVISVFLTHLEKQGPSETDYRMKQTKQSCIRVQQLVQLYKTVFDIVNKASKSSLPTTSTSQNIMETVDISHFASALCISETEVGRILSYITLHQTIIPFIKKQVKFSDGEDMTLTLPEFLGFFNITDSPLQKTGEEVVIKNLPIDLKPNLSEKQLANLGYFLFHTSIYVDGCHSTLQIALRESRVLPEKLLQLLLCHWVSDNFCENPQKWLNLQQAMHHICSLGDPKQVSADSELISPWWKTVRDFLQLSSSNVAAYICAIVARSVSIVLAARIHAELKKAAGEHKKPKETEKSEDSGDSDWEAVSLDLEHWNLSVKQLEDVLLLSILLKSQPCGKVVLRDVNISIHCLLNGGQGTVTDLVAVWAVCVGLQPALLSSFFSDSNDDVDDSVPEKFISDSKLELQTIIMVKGIINDLRKKFPYSLNHDVLLANCSWEHLMQWNRHKDSVEHLKHSLSCFQLIQSAVIKNGFALMMWKSCIQNKFEDLAMLIEKVGKTPKDRLCRKELQINDNRLEDFIDYCCELLTIILETSLVAEVEAVPKYQCEDFWQDRENQGPTPLILMAMGQKMSNSNTVYQHVLLSVLLHLIVTFQMKNSRPIGLFSDTVKKVFFRELHFNLKAGSNNTDSGLQQARSQFLLKAVSLIAQSVTESVPEIPATPAVVSTPTEGTVLCGLEGQRLASHWFNKVIDLGRDWDLQLDDLRRHYVCELYSCGHDSLAEQVMSSVTEKGMLASQLLFIAGQRIYKLIYDSEEPATNLGFVSPDVSAWLKTLGDKKLRCYNVPLQSTVNMTNHILSYVAEGNHEYALAQSLQDTLRGISNCYQ